MYDTIIDDKALLRQHDEEQSKANNAITPALNGMSSYLHQPVKSTAINHTSSLTLASPKSTAMHSPRHCSAALQGWEALLTPEGGTDGSSRNLHAVINSNFNLHSNTNITAGFPNIPADVLNMHDDVFTEDEDGINSRKSTGNTFGSSMITPKLNPTATTSASGTYSSRPGSNRASTRKWSADLNQIFNQLSQPRMTVNIKPEKKRVGWITLNQFVHLATNLRAGGQRDAQVLVLTHRTFCESKFSLLGDKIVLLMD